MQRNKVYNLKANDIYGKRSCSKIKLVVSKIRDHIRKYHPLKHRKLKEAQINRVFENSVTVPQKSRTKHKFTVTKHEEVYEICQWLISRGMKVEKINQGYYYINGKNYSVGQMLIVANRERIKLGLSPFLMIEINRDV